MKIAIIGAGPSGLAAAYELTRRKIDVDIYESRKEAGGLSASIQLWGENIELGPHYLLKNTDEDVKNLIHELLGKNNLHHYKRLTRIYLENKYIVYPPKPMALMKILGFKHTILTIIAFCNPFLPAIYKRRANSYENYVKKHLGSHIFNRFFRQYTEKLWGIPCSEINEDYAISLIGVGSLNSTTLLKKVLGQEKGKNHIDCIYPKKGMSMLWKALKQTIEKQGGAFYFSADIKQISLNGNPSLELPENTTKEYDYIISTIPETKLLQLINDPGAQSLLETSKHLTFRHVIFVFLKIGHANVIPDNNIYFYNVNIRSTRITNYNRFRNQPGNDILMLEYWLYEKDTLWQGEDEQLLEIATQDLRKIAPDKEVTILDSKVIRMRNAFPVPDMKIKKVKVAMNDYLNRYKNLIRTGRSNQNNFNYGMEEAIKDGLACARNIVYETAGDM